jgi:hypothetical protein
MAMSNVLQQMENFGVFLPRYLSEASANVLLQDLLKFPSEFDSRIFSFTAAASSDLIYQGDGFDKLDFVFLPKTEKLSCKGLILSNTCDMDLTNEKAVSRLIIYSPIFSLARFEAQLIKTKGLDFTKEYMGKIRRQEISQLFYLPAGPQTQEESFVDLAQINHCTREILSEEQVKTNRLFSLNNTGFYVLLFKLSVFFCRLQEGIDRK